MKKLKQYSIYCYQNVKKGHSRFGWYYIGRTFGRNKIRDHRHEGLLGKDLQTFPDNIISLVVWIGKCSPKEINEKERYYIKEYNSVSPNGYNLNHGGAGVIEHTEEVKARIGRLVRIALKCPGVKEKHRKAVNRPEVKENSRKTATEQWKDPGVRKKTIKSLKVAANRPEVKVKRSRAQKIAQNRPEVKEKKRKAHQGTKYSEETKAKMRKSQQERRRREKRRKNNL